MEKTVLIYANELEKSQQLAKTLKEKILQTNIQLIEEGQPDYIITIGGDGTLLAAFHQFQSYIDVSRFIGIHTGHLGFYTDWLPHELDQLINELEASDGASISYPLINIEIQTEDGQTESLLALNECSVRSLKGTTVIDVLINDYFLETFRGDGMCISSPTGSTGLNKSLGGAIIHPRVEALQLTEMASINNRIYRTVASPMIVPNDEWISLGFNQTQEDIFLQVDHIVHRNISLRSIRAQIATEKIKFARFRHTHFWDRVENAFLGNKTHFRRKNL